jgi:hypothetical protein
VTHLFDPSVRIKLSRLVPRPKKGGIEVIRLEGQWWKRKESGKDQHERTVMARVEWNRIMNTVMTMVIYSIAVQYSTVQ